MESVHLPSFFLNGYFCVYGCMKYSWRPEEGIISPGTRVTGYVWVLGIKPMSSGRTASVFIAEPSLQLDSTNFLKSTLGL